MIGTSPRIQFNLDSICHHHRNHWKTIINNYDDGEVGEESKISHLQGKDTATAGEDTIGFGYPPVSQPIVVSSDYNSFPSLQESISFCGEWWFHSVYGLIPYLILLTPFKVYKSTGETHTAMRWLIRELFTPLWLVSFPRLLGPSFNLFDLLREEGSTRVIWLIP